MTHRQAVVGMLLVTFLWSIAGVVTRHLEAARSFEVTFWRSAANALVRLGFIGSQAQHVAQHSDAEAARIEMLECLQRVQRCLDSGWRRVVRVIQQQAALDPAEQARSARKRHK